MTKTTATTPIIKNFWFKVLKPSQAAWLDNPFAGYGGGVWIDEPNRVVVRCPQVLTLSVPFSTFLRHNDIKQSNTNFDKDDFDPAEEHLFPGVMRLQIFQRRPSKYYL